MSSEEEWKAVEGRYLFLYQKRMDLFRQRDHEGMKAFRESPEDAELSKLNLMRLRYLYQQKKGDQAQKKDDNIQKKSRSRKPKEASPVANSKSYAREIDDEYNDVADRILEAAVHLHALLDEALRIKGADKQSAMDSTEQFLARHVKQLSHLQAELLANLHYQEHYFWASGNTDEEPY